MIDTFARLVAVPLSLLLLACSPASQESASPAPVEPPSTALEEPAPVAADVLVESGGSSLYEFKITYPTLMLEHPQLATALTNFAQELRDNYIETVTEVGEVANPETLPWSLNIEFEALHQDSRLVVVGADGHAYSGGAHGMPVLGRFVLYVPAQRMLAIEDWFVGGEVWPAFGEALRDALFAGVLYRYSELYEDEGDLQQALAAKRDWVESGAASDPDNYQIYEPVLTDAGKIRALRVWFPPYQIGPYAEGIEYADVPVDVFADRLRIEYRGLFDLSN